MDSEKQLIEHSGSPDCSSSAQLTLTFGSRRIEPAVLVKLTDTDRHYRQSCINKDTEFGEAFLKETRAQRLGCSVRDIECMLNYERNRHLAEEAVAMRLPSWATDPVTYIDWQTINERAKIKQQELADDFAAFRERRRESLLIEDKTKRRKTV
jgi:hypothetical protein